MPHSKLSVDRLVNLAFIAADERSTDHSWMNEQDRFQERLAEAVAASPARSLTGLVRLLGVPENEKQTAYNWRVRGKIPLEYGKALAGLGLSIDYVNDGDGQLRLVRSTSQDLRAMRQMIQAGIVLYDHIRDSSLGPIPEHLRGQVEEEIAAEIDLRGAAAILSGEQLETAAQSIRTKVRSMG